MTLKPLVPNPLLGDSGTPVNTIIDWDEYSPRDATRFNDDVAKRIQGRKEELLLFAIISAKLGRTHYSLRGLILKANIDGSTQRLGMFESGVHQDSQHIQELLLTRSGLPQDNKMAVAEPPKVRFDDPGLADFVQDITIV